MIGHILMFDGTRLGLTPESHVGEVAEALGAVGVSHLLLRHCAEVTIVFDYKNYYYKDRSFGRCDFKSAPPPEFPICGD